MCKEEILYMEKSIMIVFPIFCARKRTALLHPCYHFVLFTSRWHPTFPPSLDLAVPIITRSVLFSNSITRCKQPQNCKNAAICWFPFHTQVADYDIEGEEFTTLVRVLTLNI